MPRIKRTVQIKVDIATKNAKKQVYDETKIKKRKEKRGEKDTPSSISPKSSWIEDPIRKQGMVFFDGYKYWLTMISPKYRKEIIRKISFAGLTPEQWEERIKKGESNELGREEVRTKKTRKNS